MAMNTRERNSKIECIGKGKVARRRANLAMEIEFPRRKFSGDSLCYYSCATQHRERTFAKHHKALREKFGCRGSRSWHPNEELKFEIIGEFRIDNFGEILTSI